MKLINSEQVRSALNFEELIPALRRDFGQHFGIRKQDSENTLFVSVGTALSDLTAAYMAYQKN